MNKHFLANNGFVSFTATITIVIVMLLVIGGIVGFSSLQNSTNNGAAFVIRTSNNEATLGEVFGIDIEAGKELLKNNDLEKIDLYIDDQLESSCVDLVNCSFLVGPFIEQDISEHKYEIRFMNQEEVLYRDAGVYFVTNDESRIAKNDEASRSSNNGNAKIALHTSNPQAQIDSLLSIFVEVASTPAPERIEIYIDDEKLQACQKDNYCNTKYLTNKKNIGNHTVSAIATLVNGDVIEATKEFTVEKFTRTTTIIQPEDVDIEETNTARSDKENQDENSRTDTANNSNIEVSIKANKTVLTDGETVTLTATATEGSSPLIKLQIISGAEVYKTCTSSPCVYSGSNFPVGVSTGIAAKATLADGSTQTSDLEIISFTYVLPEVNLSIDKATANEGENVRFTATATTASSPLSKLEIVGYQSGMIYKTCTSSPCAYSTTSLPEGITSGFQAKVTLQDDYTKLSNSETITIFANQDSRQ